jgi:uncharacterized protein (DUF362 family)
MDDFIKIISVFSDKSERNLKYLSSVYQDIDKMEMIISDLIKGTLTKDTINGKRILIKPNWVKQDNNSSDELCLRTHKNFLLSLLEVLLPLKPLEVTIGDAPIQGCLWGKMISSELTEKISNLSIKHGINIKIKDFRRTTFELSKNKPVNEKLPISNYIIFDLGKNSYLEPISYTRKPLFRVTNYNPECMTHAHNQGIHKYCLARDLFDADVIISVPKIKTHEKTGITAALKNIVGLNGDKDFLPHHRLGGTGFGGDCYPGKNYFRYFSELALDKANRRLGNKYYRCWTKLSSAFWKLSLPGKEHNIAAGWYGNDTTWRMVLDLNKIVSWGRKDGTMASAPQRQLFSLCDGIIGGEGDGPLEPEPLPFGLVTFTDNSVANDIIIATLMGFDYKRFPLLREAENLFPVQGCRLFLNGQATDISKIKNLTIKTQPPHGWENYLLIR